MDSQSEAVRFIGYTFFAVCAAVFLLHTPSGILVLFGALILLFAALAIIIWPLYWLAEWFERRKQRREAARIARLWQIVREDAP